MDVKYGEMMQAFSHFSYHHSRGQYVICDLQGGTNGNSVILTDPAIQSRNKRFTKTNLINLITLIKPPFNHVFISDNPIIRDNNPL